jgi:hypothetical protein
MLACQMAVCKQIDQILLERLATKLPAFYENKRIVETFSSSGPLPGPDESHPHSFSPSVSLLCYVRRDVWRWVNPLPVRIYGIHSFRIKSEREQAVELNRSYFFLPFVVLRVVTPYCLVHVYPGLEERIAPILKVQRCRWRHDVTIQKTAITSNVLYEV